MYHSVRVLLRLLRRACFPVCEVRPEIHSSQISTFFSQVEVGSYEMSPSEKDFYKSMYTRSATQFDTYVNEGTDEQGVLYKSMYTRSAIRHLYPRRPAMPMAPCSCCSQGPLYISPCTRGRK